jgi:hydrogenase maturation protein HypF
MGWPADELKIVQGTPSPYDPTRILRLRVVIRGAVQGVGFRPFVYRLATELGLPGWISNTAQGVFIEVDGPKSTLDDFLLRLGRERPPRSFVQSLESSFLDPVGFTRFEIRNSDEAGAKTALVLPDIGTCPDCLREIFDPHDRRYLYPFTNCTNCGPRFSIIEALPYDRVNTSMRKFEMCPACRREYEDPLDRRFHAQPNACPSCGPHVELWDERGEFLLRDHAAIAGAAEALRSGKIVALKGLGGFQLLVDARDEEAVARLRNRKHREEKPFALMFPSLEAVEVECVVTELENRLLVSPESPIVLLQRQLSIDNRQFPPKAPAPKASFGPAMRSGGDAPLAQQIATSVAPSNPCLGVMLPYTPLHHLLMKEIGFPVVATSGNLSDEPICTDEYEAVERLKGTPDLFLVHDRPIVRHVDDSIVRVMMDRELVLRRARGYAPLPIQANLPIESSILAVGAHLKNTVAISVGNNAFISQHIGDLETQQSLEAFRKVTKDLQALYDVKPSLVACDLHPDYASSRDARKLAAEVVEIQHHYAHAMACMAENQLQDAVLGVSWDGTGFGLDGTIWGGEFLAVDEGSFVRVATFRRFPLPGGEQAIKEPRRSALGLLFEVYGDDVFKEGGRLPQKVFSTTELHALRRMLHNKLNCPLTSSVGRLFDAVASIAGLRQRVTFEGQAPMELEFATAGHASDEVYRFAVSNEPLPRGDSERALQHSMMENQQSLLVVDWSPAIREILEDVQQSIPLPLISLKFHNMLAEVVVEIARRIGLKQVVLSGGCFQNKYLTERVIRRLEASGFRPYWHQRVPPNDGGISLGQLLAVAGLRRQREQPGGAALHEVVR